MSKPKQIKIPFSIERTEASRYNYFFNEKKTFRLLVILLLCFVFTFGCIKIGSMVMINGITYGLYFGLGISLIVLFQTVRFVIFEETRQRELMKKLYDNQISPYTKVMSISKIDDNGLIHYKYNGEKLTKALVIKVTKGSVVGRPENFTAQYHQFISEFYRKILSEKLRIRHYSDHETEIPANLNYLIKKANEQQDPFIRNLNVLYTDNLLHQVITAGAIEVDYYMIYCDNYLQMRKFYRIVQNILENTLESNFFKHKKILNKAEVEHFNAQVLQLSSFPDIDEGVIVDFAEYGEVVRAFSSSGEEIFIDGLDLEKQYLDNPKNQEEDGKKVSATSELHEAQEGLVNHPEAKEIEDLAEETLLDAIVDKNTNEEAEDLLSILKNKKAK